MQKQYFIQGLTVLVSFLIVIAFTHHWIVTF